MKKQFIAKLLVLCMVISMLPMAVFAAPDVAPQSDSGTYSIRVDANDPDKGEVTANYTYETGADAKSIDLSTGEASIPAEAKTVNVTIAAKDDYTVKYGEDGSYYQVLVYSVSADTAPKNWFASDDEGKTATATITSLGEIIVYPVYADGNPPDNPPDDNPSDNPPDDNPSDDTPTTSGGTTSDKVTVEEPATSGGATTVSITVNSKTSGTKTTANVSERDMNKAVNAAVNAAAKAGTAPALEVKVKTTGKTATVNVNLPTKSLKTLGKAEGATLKITSDVVDMALDSASTAALAEQAAGGTVAISMKPVQASSLNDAQKEAAKNATVIDVSVTSNGNQITSFNGGKLTIAVAYTLPSGVAEADVQVYYLTDKGILQSHETSYAGGKVTFITTHLSKYVIGTKDMSGMSFEDVAAGQYYYDAVAWAAKTQITAGVSATMFAPDKTCTRAEIVSFLWRSAGSPEPAAAENPFEDVDSSAYYYKAVMWAVEKGITAGTSETTFSPDKTCTRAEAMAFLYRSVGSPAASGVGSFTDVPADAYYNSAVAWAVKSNITAGTSETTFSPDKTCSRAEIVTFLYRNAL